MREKLFEIINKAPWGIIWLGNKKVFIEEKFGEKKNVIKNYQITSVSIEENECLITYFLVGDNTFIHTSRTNDLSDIFIAQVLTSLI